MDGLAGLAMRLKMDLSNKVKSMEEMLLFNPFQASSAKHVQKIIDGYDFNHHVYAD